MTSAARMKPSLRKVYDVFVAHGYGWVRGADLLAAGSTRYSARLYDLKEFGWAHEKRPDPTSALPLYRIYPIEPEQLTLGVAS